MIVDFINKKYVSVVLLLIGITVCQVTLLFPSFSGKKVLLPLRVLSLPGVYSPDRDVGRPEQWVQGDKVLQVEPFRLYSSAEVRKGRLPFWNPYSFCGAPYSMIYVVPSIFQAVSYIFTSVRVLPWVQLLRAILSGIGAYFFFRRVLKARRLSALFGGLCYPLSGALALWQGFAIADTCVWLPWMLMAADGVVNGHKPSAAGGLAILTYITVLSGHPETSVQIMIVSGLFFFWQMIDRYRLKGLFEKSGSKTMLIAALAVSIGVVATLPFWFHGIEYVFTGHRIAMRLEGHEDIPSIGLAAFLQILFPLIQGSSMKMGVYTGAANLLESAAAGYAGLICAAFLSPLAILNRRLKKQNIFWLLLAFLGMAYVLNIPLISTMFTKMPFAILRGNRMPLFTAWAVLALAVTGFDAIENGQVKWSRWCLIPMAVLLCLGIWCGYRAFNLPSSYSERLSQGLRSGFVKMYAYNCMLCCIAFVLWLVLRFMPGLLRRKGPLLCVLALLELSCFNLNLNPQEDPALYYPRLPVIEALKAAPPGRVCGFGCLPPNITMMSGLRDIRGYDAIDPQQLVDLLSIINPRWDKKPKYAVTQWFIPEESPLSHMLNLRYLIFRSPMPVGFNEPGTRLYYRDSDYWVLENLNVLPRPYVPRGIQTLSSRGEVLLKLSNKSFDPSQTAYIEENVDLPDSGIKGSALIAEEEPSRIVIDAQFQTRGMIVISDLWYKDWNAYVNGRKEPVYRVNYAIKGVIVPEGQSRVELRYEPVLVKWGMRLMCVMLLFMVAWFYWALRLRIRL